MRRSGRGRVARGGVGLRLERVGFYLSVFSSRGYRSLGFERVFISFFCEI